MPLCHSVDFSGIGSLPQQAIRTVAEFLVFCKFTMHIQIEGIAIEGNIWYWIGLCIGQIGSIALSGVVLSLLM